MTRTYRILFVVINAALGVALNVAFADDVINACVTRGGTLHVVGPGEVCKKEETSISLAAAGQLGGNGQDVEPPVIDFDLPETASASETVVPITFSDNVELGRPGVSMNTGLAGLRGDTSVGFGGEAFSPGVALASGELVTTVKLGEDTYGFVSVTDTSGNMAKKALAINSPSIPLQFGSYRILGPSEFPAGFSCQPPDWFNEFDGQSVSEILIEGGWPSDGWSVQDGMSFAAFAVYSDMALGFDFRKAPLYETSFTASTHSDLFKFAATLQILGGDPSRIELEITMACTESQDEPREWTQGVPAVFTGE